MSRGAAAAAALIIGGVAIAGRAAGAPPAPGRGTGGETCPSKGVHVSASALVRASGTAAIGRTVVFDASSSKLVVVRRCEVTSRTVPSSAWQLVGRPSGSAAGLGPGSRQRAELKLDVAGSYRVRFVVCPRMCRLSIGGAVFTVAPKAADATVSVVPDQTPRAALRVYVPRRADLSWSYWDRARDTYRPGYAYADDWRVSADACGSVGGTDSTGAPSALSSFRFRFERLDGPDDPIERTTRACRLRLGLPALGRWRVQVTVTAGDGRSAAAEGQARDRLVLALGDSMTSGEGNPDVDRLFLIRPATWKDRQCDRSAASWAARLARSLENDSTSVTFLDFACSGATVDDIVDGGYLGENRQPGDDALPAQPVAARQVLGDPGSTSTRTVDTVLMTAGINDLGFGDALTACAKQFDNNDCTLDNSGYLIVKGLQELPGRYPELDAAIAANVKAARIVVLEYPTRLFTDDHDRPTRCGGFKLHNLSIDEAEWFMRRGDDLNAELRAAATANGWTYVGGIRDRFRGHGYCASDDQTWFRSYSGSKKLQGDDHGTAHPNRAGHAAMAKVAEPVVRANPPAPEPVHVAVQLLQVRADDPAEKPGVPGVRVIPPPRPLHAFFSVTGYGGTSVPSAAAQAIPLGRWVEPTAAFTFDTVTDGNTIAVKGSITLPSLRIDAPIDDPAAPKGFIDTGPRRLAFERFHRRAEGWGVPSGGGVGLRYGPVQHVLVRGNGSSTLQVDYRVGVERLPPGTATRTQRAR